MVKIDNVTIKKNSDGQIYSVGGGSGGGDYYEGDNVYFTTNAGRTYINAEEYTAGDGITISSSKKISAKVDDQTIHTNRYGELCMDAVPIEAGEGINIDGNGKISIDPVEVADEIDLSSYQKKLVAGNNIIIDPTTNVISSTGGGGGGGSTNWGSIGGSISNQPDLMAALNAKADDGDIPTKVSQLENDVPYATQASVTSLASNKQDKLTAGANITISSDNVISATGGGGGPTQVNFSDLVGSPLDNAALKAQIDDAKTKPDVYNSSVFVYKNSVTSGNLIGGFSLNQATSSNLVIPIPDVPTPVQPGDGTLTITQNGSQLGVFTANQSGNTTIAIPSSAANNGQLDIQRNGTSQGKFTANQSTNSSVNIKVPTFSLSGTVLTITDN